MFQIALDGQVQGIWYVGALYTFVVCFYSVWFQIRTRYWSTTDGDLLTLETRKFGATDRVTANQDYISEALYSYEVNGRSYEGVRVSPWIFVASHNARFLLHKQLNKVQAQPDGKVKVFYNPSKPDKSYLIVAGKAGISATILLGLFPLISYWLKFHM